MKISITGISGFVGSNLAQYLANRFKVTSIDLRNLSWKSNIDLNTQAIIHLAGKAHDLKKATNPQEYYDVNYELTKQLFDVFLLSESKIFIFVSSVKAVADEVKDVLTEEEEPNPQTHYGKSKLLAENYILSKEIPQGKRIYILRPCMIHGAGNKGNLNLLYKLVSKGIPWPLGAFENTRSFCNIDNFCFIINEILENEDISSGIYNLADDDAVSTNRLITIIATSQNKKERIVRIPESLISSIAKTGDLFKLPINSERLQKLTESYIVSNEKIIKAISKPLPITTEEGFVKTFESFRLNN